MRKKLMVTSVFTLIVFMLIALATAYGSPDYERVIISFDAGIKPEIQNSLVNRHGYFIKHLHLINATVAMVPPKEKANLVKERGVLRVEDDLQIFASTNQASKQTSSELIPWGVSRINADRVWPTSVGAGIKVAVIDTGIDISHLDLVSNVKGGFNTINHKASINDDNGHGSHVAGVIAAVGDGAGIIGVAPKAELYAVKALDRTGAGRVSDIIEGIQWSVDNHMQIANMSFGTTSYSRALHNSVKKASNSGLIMIAAAGNDGPGLNTVNYPAKFNEVVAVSAIDENSVIAFFSSRGPEIDVAAPGNNIYSTYNNSRYMILSGTSMAAPHVTGATAVKLQLSPGLTPTQIMDILKKTANYLPNVTSAEQGAGLVDAYNLVSVK